MKKESIKQLNNLNLTSEEKALIKMINRSLSTLQSETTNYLNKYDFFIEANDLKSIFFDDTKGDSLISKYREILNDLRLGIEKILIRSRELVEIKKPIVNVEMEKEIAILVNSIKNLNHFFLLSSKQEALSKVVEIKNSTMETDKKTFYQQKLLIIVEEIENVISNDKFIEIASLERDLEYIKNIDTELKKKNFSFYQILSLIIVFSLGIIFLILGITFLII